MVCNFMTPHVASLVAGQILRSIERENACLLILGLSSLRLSSVSSVCVSLCGFCCMNSSIGVNVSHVLC